MLIYCAYAVIDREAEPDWVGKLADNAIVRAEGWQLYRPFYGFTENIKNPGMLGLLSDRAAVVDPTTMRLDPELAKPLAGVYGRLQAADMGPFTDVSFKRLYALLRADLVLVDLDVPGFGSEAHETLYAYLAGIPVVGIAHRFLLSPSMLDKTEAVVFARNSDQIVRQVLAFDRRTTSLLRQNALAVEQARKLQDLGEQLAGLPTETGPETEQPDGRNEGAG